MSYRSAAPACLVIAVNLHAYLWAGTIQLTSVPPASNGPFVVTSVGMGNFGGNNDNSPGPSGPGDPVNRFNFSTIVNGLTAQDMQLPVNNSGGVREYYFSANIVNGTDRPWINYELQLGYGLGASFVPSSSDDGLDFDLPHQDPAVSSTPLFSLIEHNENGIRFVGATIPIGGVLQLRFSVDVPDLPDGRTSFTLRQVAAPEPATIVLAIFAAIGGAMVVRRAAKGSKSATPSD